MHPVLYFKAVIGAVGANVFPPIAHWLVSLIPGAPDDVRTALSVLLVALLTGGLVYGTPNRPAEPAQPVQPAHV